MLHYVILQIFTVIWCDQQLLWIYFAEPKSILYGSKLFVCICSLVWWLDNNFFHKFLHSEIIQKKYLETFENHTLYFFYYLFEIPSSNWAIYDFFLSSFLAIPDKEVVIVGGSTTSVSSTMYNSLNKITCTIASYNQATMTYTDQVCDYVFGRGICCGGR